MAPNLVSGLCLVLVAIKRTSSLVRRRTLRSKGGGRMAVPSPYSSLLPTYLCRLSRQADRPPELLHGGILASEVVLVVRVLLPRLEPT